MIHRDEGIEQRVRALKEERSELHPDKNGGKFASAVAQNRYFQIDQELEQLRSGQSEPSHELIPVSQLPALFEALSASLERKSNSAQDIERELRRDSKLELSRKYRTPKISSVAAAAAVGFIFTQAHTLAEHPLLGPFFESQIGLLALGYAFILSLGVLAGAWIRERSEESLIARLMSRNALFQVVSHLDALPEGHLINESELRHLLFAHVRGLRNVWIFPGPDEPTIEGILELQLQRLVERKIVREYPSNRGIDRVFQKL